MASVDKATAVAKNLKHKNVRALAIESDQGDPAKAKALIRPVVDHFGCIDMLFNNAAVAWQGMTIDDPDIDNDAMDRQWAITAGRGYRLTAAVRSTVPWSACQRSTRRGAGQLKGRFPNGFLADRCTVGVLRGHWRLLRG